MIATRLRMEYLKNPLGIDIPHPRIFWNCQGGKKQTAFQIVFSMDGKVVLDTGKVISSSMHFDYPEILHSRDRIEYQVTLFDEEDKAEEATENGFFEMGLLNPSDWKGKWISGDYHPRKNCRYPVDCFRKKFEAKEIKKARLYISACGLYEASINQKKVGDYIFAPGFTDPRKRIQYQTYDVTDMILEGKNEITVLLADGYFRGSSGAKGRVNTYGKTTGLILQLELSYQDGSSSIIFSDGTFSWSDDGEIRFADMKDGERVDARMEPTYAGKAKVQDWHYHLSASNNVPVRERERFHPVKMTRTETGKTIFRFPQNLSGYVSFKVNAKSGDRIHIRLGEMLDEKGELTLKNVQCTFKGKLSPLQDIDYICKDGENIYTPKFFYGGFQYAEVVSDVSLTMEDIQAISVCSDFERSGEFHCSNSLLNQFFENTMWSLKSNSTDIPSDCPTRERMGWMGDSQIFFDTASFLVDYASFARKHVKDIFDRQWNNGRLPQIAPYAHEDWYMWVMNGSVGWACAGVYIPLYFYKKYGDERILEANYGGMLKYASFMMKRAGKWGGVYAKPMHLSHKNRKYAVNCGQSYGEWAEPNDICSFKWYDFASPHPEESTAYTYFTLNRVLEVAKILGKKEDKFLLKVKEYSEGAKRAYQELVTKKKFSLDTDRQAKLVRPLYMGLLNEEQDKFAKKRLLEAVKNYDYRLGTGFLSTPYILYVLEDLDLDTCYRLVENEKMPGWLFMVKQGATTIWEAWEGNTTKDAGIASLNHYSKGALSQWLMDSMCGIRMNGENCFDIVPHPGGDITSASASYESIYGLVKSSWKKEGDKTVFEVQIPSNCQARILLPGKEAKMVPAGNYRFEI